MLFAGCQVLFKELFKIKPADGVEEHLTPVQAIMHTSGLLLALQLVVTNKELWAYLYPRLSKAEIS